MLEHEPLIQDIQEQQCRAMIPAIDRLDELSRAYEQTGKIDLQEVAVRCGEIDFCPLQYELLKDAQTCEKWLLIVHGLLGSLHRFSEVDPFFDADRKLGIRDLEEQMMTIRDQAEYKFPTP